MKLGIFSLGRTKLAKVTYSFSDDFHKYLLFNNNIHKYFEFLLQEKPDFIVGLGIYSRRDQDKIRIEKKCSNKFRGNLIESDQFVEYEIPYFLTPDFNFKLASGIGNSYCNYFSFKIVKFLLDNKLKTKFTFLHIPKTMKLDKVTELISAKLEDYLSDLAQR